MSADFMNRIAALPGTAPAVQRPDGRWIDAPALDVRALARLMQELSFRLSTMTGVALRDGETAVIYHYCRGTEAVNVRVRTSGNVLPSIAAITLSAAWAEREIHDLYAVEFAGHPDLARLILPAQLAAGLFRPKDED